MITQFVFGLLVGAVELFLDAMPGLTFALDQLGGATGLIELAARVNFIFPLRLVGEFMAIWLVLEVFEFGKRIFDFIIAKIPTIR